MEDRFDFGWIVDFPMYERDPDTGKLDFSHNPFSMPQGGLEALETRRRWRFWDFSTISSATASSCPRGRSGTTSRRSCTRPSSWSGYDRADVDGHFGGMISAFRYGAPPHAGFAPGIDRIVMLLAGEENIREVIMFPMNQRAEDLMMGAPSEPTDEQLRELGSSADSQGLTAGS